MSVEVDGADEAAKLLDDTAKRFRQIQRGTASILRVLAADIKQLIDDSFEHSRSPMGDAFQPLSPITVARRRVGQGDGPAKPLIDTSRLRNSITSFPVPKGVRFGTNTIYAATHQWGRGRIPARPFLPIEGNAFGSRGPAGLLRDEMRRDLAKWITEGRT